MGPKGLKDFAKAPYNFINAPVMFYQTQLGWKLGNKEKREIILPIDS